MARQSASSTSRPAGDRPLRDALSQSSAPQSRAQSVLGIDPGLNRTGYCLLSPGVPGPVLREAGVIRSSGALSLAERVAEIGLGLRDVCRQYQPSVMAIEQVFSTGRFPKSALLMAHARGVILFAAAEAGMQVVHYTPRQIKRLLTGSGKADKSQIQRAVARELRLDRLPEPHDVADAAAAALCHYYMACIPSGLRRPA
ncbi:MAG: crossover junction endodeoxyribonuclease RuvC [Planctomycetaceae bacterium]